MKRHTYKPGDQVKILRSNFVKRVGYPLVWTDLREEVENDPRTDQAWRILTDQPRPSQVGDLFALSASQHYPHEFIRAICMERVRERNFGGQTRGLILYETVSDEQVAIAGQQVHNRDGCVYTVQGTRRVQIGQRVAPRSGAYHGPDGSEYWEESGGLENRKTVVLLEVGWHEISSEDVELVMKGPKK